ncbi:MAG TPA: ABC transporter permease [Thermoanaerobaculia bacterium]|nr:ABC transporter permease [Thermoanaerobaculia bacterium]
MRRELWENRSIYIAPLVVAMVELIGFSISSIGLPHRRRAVLMLDAAQQRAAIQRPYDIAAFMLLLTAFIVGVFYCVDALYGERRDRSILFWKSLPVSDRTTVLSKAGIPLLVLPLITFAMVIITQAIMLLLSSVVLLMNGLSPATTWKYVNPFHDWPILLYGLIVIALWHAPIYAWLLLVSCWAKRAVILWAVFPFFAIGVLDAIALNGKHVRSLLMYRLMGGFARAFDFGAHGEVNSLTQLTPGRFLSTPGLWIGLAFAAAFLAVAVRVRRNREPI